LHVDDSSNKVGVEIQIIAPHPRDIDKLDSACHARNPCNEQSASANRRGRKATRIPELVKKKNNFSNQYDGGSTINS